ncbi:MAG: CDP-alcohol phosphatidyltransferase family protein [Bacteroidota bacterium]
MSKLSEKDKFLDLSDYGRPLAKVFANSLKNTRFTAIHVTFLFGIVGLIAIYFILNESFIFAGIALVLKSIIDAADGELARLKNNPSYIGRYLDSIFDILLNLLIFLAISYKTDSNLILTLLAFFCCQLQGTVYNFYYVILRNRSLGGDKTSKIIERKTPKAIGDESQKIVNVLFVLYLVFYGVFDKIIQFLDQKAFSSSSFPKWFMTFVSIYGLGFQLLIITLMLSLNLIDFIIPFFICYTFFVFILIGIRKSLL